MKIDRKRAREIWPKIPEKVILKKSSLKNNLDSRDKARNLNEGLRLYRSLQFCLTP